MLPSCFFAIPFASLGFDSSMRPGVVTRFVRCAKKKSVGGGWRARVAEQVVGRYRGWGASAAEVLDGVNRIINSNKKDDYVSQST